MMRQTKIFIPLLISILLLIFISVIYFRYQKQNYTIERNQEGFYPQKIVINKGARVVFVNKSKEAMWPASDPHPTHDYLKEFDPQKAVASGGSWEFTFKERGIFKYHDHLNITFRGIIEVVDETKPGSSENEDDYCQSQDRKDKEKCFNEKITNAVETKGLEAAYALFSKMFEEGEAPAGCHWTAHLIGEAAYKEYKKGKDIPIDRAASYCGYAFYHGFLEKLLRENPDPDRAIKFCRFAAKKFAADPQAADNCYHGIGHGFTEEPPPQNSWGNAKEMLAPGLAVCESLFGDTENKWEICATGVYTVVAKFIREGKYGFNIFDEKDPFAFCRGEPKRYHRACFGEFAAKLDSITNWDIGSVKKFTDEIKDTELNKIVVRTAAGAMMQRDIVRDDLSSYILGCRKYEPDLKKACLEGIIWGFIQHGEPNKEYVKMVKFCGDESLDREEKEFCFQNIAGHIRRIYQNNWKEICRSIPLNYQKYCADNNG